MKKYIHIAAVLLACTIMLALQNEAQGASVVTNQIFFEDFSGYTNNMVLARRTTVAEDYVAFDGWSPSLTENLVQSTLVLLVRTNAAGAYWNPDIGHRLLSDGTSNANWKRTYYKDLESTFAEVKSDSKLRIYFIANWNTGSGTLYLGIGNDNGNAFEFRNRTWNYYLADALGTEATDDENDAPGYNYWYDCELLVDLAANSGNGSISMNWRRHGLTTWTTKPEFQDVNINLQSNALVNVASDWDRLMVYIPGGGNGTVGEISIDHIYTPVPTGTVLIVE